MNAVCYSNQQYLGLNEVSWMDLLNDLFIYILRNIIEIPLESQKLELEAIFP